MSELVVPRPPRGQRVHVWVPRRSEQRHLDLLPAGVDVHVQPGDVEKDMRYGPGQFVVGGFARRSLPELLRRLDDVRVVQAMSAGVDDLIGHVPNGVVLCDGAGIHDVGVSEWTVMAILAMTRNLPASVHDQAAARWGSRGFTAPDLEGSTVLILGYGSIGRALERRLQPFGARFLRVGRQSREGVSGPEELAALLPQADVVVVLLPLTPDTRGFVDAGFLASMKPGALLVNPSRGAVVDTGALMKALDERRIRAALDVTDPEPLPDGHELWRKEGVLITPHIAGATSKAVDRAWALVVRQLSRYLDGEPLHNVVSDGY